MEWFPILVGLFVFGGAVRAIVLGGASYGGGGLRRDERPLMFWATVAVAMLLSASLVWQGLHPAP